MYAIRSYYALPGQFFTLCLPGVGEFPVSTAGYGQRHRLETCIRKAGRVTAALFAQPEGAVLGVRGPYGNGFPLQAFAGRDALLIAGGLGIAPLRGLLAALLDGATRTRSITLLYGARDPETLLFAEELRSLSGTSIPRRAKPMGRLQRAFWNRYVQDAGR